jgi:4-hydroxy-3-polyprenylbenzoate decarboxylase
MAFQDLREWISFLEGRGELKRVKAEVDWNLEMGAIVRRMLDRSGPGLLFENIKDHNQPGARCTRLVTSTLGHKRRLPYMFGLPAETHFRDMAKLAKDRFAGRVAPRIVQKGPCKENIVKGDDANLYDFPAPKWHHRDGGRYMVTSAAVVTRDPDSGETNVGTYRGMVASKKKMGMLLVPSQHWGAHFQKYRERQQPMPIAIVIGMEPLFRFVAATPVAHVGYPYGEYEIVGALRGAPVELVKCETQDLFVPSAAEIVLEGTMSTDPSSYEMEGPMGEFTGYYGGIAARRPTMEVSCITHRQNPVFESANEGWGPGHPNESGTYSQLSWSAIAWAALERAAVPGVKDVLLLPASVVMSLAVSIHKSYFGQAKTVAAAIWGSSIGTLGAKYVIVVDDDIDIHDPTAIEWAIAYRTRPDPTSNDFVFYPGTIGNSLDPSIPEKERRLMGRSMAKCGKLLIDATKSWELEPQEQYGGDIFPPVSFLISPEQEELLNKKWKSYGLD